MIDHSLEGLYSMLGKELYPSMNISKDATDHLNAKVKKLEDMLSDTGKTLYSLFDIDMRVINLIDLKAKVFQVYQDIVLLIGHTCSTCKGLGAIETVLPAYKVEQGITGSAKECPVCLGLGLTLEDCSEE